jgi:prophage DNA circulation protein
MLPLPLALVLAVPAYAAEPATADAAGPADPVEWAAYQDTLDRYSERMKEFQTDARTILEDVRAVTAEVRTIVGRNSGNVQEGFDGVRGAVSRLQNALDKLSEDNMDFVLSVGQACDYPFNLWTGSHLIAQLGEAHYLAQQVHES